MEVVAVEVDFSMFSSPPQKEVARRVDPMVAVAVAVDLVLLVVVAEVVVVVRTDKVVQVEQELLVVVALAELDLV